MVNRVIRDDPSKGTMHNREPITPKLLWKSLCDYDLWPLYAIGLTWLTPMTPPHQYLTLNLRAMGFNTFVTNLLTIPCTFAQIPTMITLTYLSEKFGQLTWAAMFPQFWALPFVIYLYVVDINSINKWVAWVILTIFLSIPSGTCILSNVIFGRRMRGPNDSNDKSTSNPSRLELSELEYRSLAHRVGCRVQYVRASVRDHCFEYLSERYALSSVLFLYPV